MNDEYDCKICNFHSSRKSQYDKHITTAKHIRLSNTTENISKEFVCSCGNRYKHGPSLYNHKKKCTQKDNKTGSRDVPNLGFSNENIMQLIKQNEEFKTIILEKKEIEVKQETDEFKTMVIDFMKQNQSIIVDLASKVGNNTVNNNINYNNNNSFNINLFLNETCKDAINMNDFIQNIEIQLKELENVGNNGYVTGITDIIVSRLNQLDITKRPVHCTDLKRETLYIKEQNAWNKDTNENEKMRNVITKVASKNYKTIPKWRAAHPECQEPENEEYGFCINMMRNSLGDLGDEQTRLDEKIIKNIARLVVVDKNTT